MIKISLTMQFMSLTLTLRKQCSLPRMLWAEVHLRAQLVKTILSVMLGQRRGLTP